MDSHTLVNNTQEEHCREKRMIKLMCWGYVLISLAAIVGVGGYAAYGIHKHNQKLEYFKKKYPPTPSMKKFL